VRALLAGEHLLLMSLSVFETKIHGPVTPQVLAELARKIVSTVSLSVLEERCKLFGKRLHHVKGDGSCQFRALSVVLFGNENRHEEIRAQVVNFLRQHQATMQLPLVRSVVIILFFFVLFSVLQYDSTLMPFSLLTS
jgi:hypothetical protein